MSRTKKLLIALLISPLVLAVLVVIFIGPWPAYVDSQYADQAYYRDAMAGIERHAAASTYTDDPGRLQAGWAKRNITPQIGAPMGGYSGRKNDKKSTGIRDQLYVRALALSDGVDKVILVGSDMLIIPPNIAEAVRENVAALANLSGDEVLFNASPHPLRSRWIYARVGVGRVRWRIRSTLGRGTNHRIHRCHC